MFPGASWDGTNTSGKKSSEIRQREFKSQNNLIIVLLWAAYLPALSLLFLVFFVSIRWTQLHHPDKVAVKIKMHYACEVSETQKVLSSCYIFYWNIYNIEMQVFKLLWVLFRGCQWWWAWGVVCSCLCGRAVSVWTIPWGSWGLSKRLTTGLGHWSLISNNLSQQQLCSSIWPIPNHSSLERREKSFVHRLLRQRLSSVRWNQLNQFPTAI